MRILVNYMQEEKSDLMIAGGILKRSGHTVVATNATLNISQLNELRLNRDFQIDAVVCANQETLWNLAHGANKTSITLDSFRGSVLQYNPSVLVVNSLAHVRTVKHGKWLLERDFDKLNHLHDPISVPSYKLIENQNDFSEAYHRLIQSLIISIDIETNPDTQAITCVSYTCLEADGKSTFSCLIPFIDFGVDHWKTDIEYANAIGWMRRINSLPQPKLMFNAGYDASYFLRYRAPPENLTLDAMGFAHSCYSELPKSLDFVCSLYDPSYIQWKHEADLARKNNDIQSYRYYCVKDSFNTLKVLLLNYKVAPEWAVGNYQRKFKLTYPCLYCAFEGIRVNQEKKKVLTEAALAKLEAAKKKLQIMSANPEFNPGSPKQVSHLIYKVLGARPIKGESTNEKILNSVAEQHPLLARFIDLILEYRGEQKAYGTYFTFKEINGRMLYNLGPFGTESGRMSSTQSNFGVGAQVQNVPYYAKGMLEADDGFVIFEPDNSKAEARIVAAISRCLALQKALNDPEKDFYKLLAVIFFGLPYETVTDELRNKVMKRIVHGTNYMMGVNTFIVNATPKQIREGARLLGYKLKKMEDFVKYLLGLYHKNFPEVSKHYEEIKQQLLMDHKLVSVLGYVRWFFGDPIKNHEVLRGAVAHEPQNLNVDILNIGFWKIYQQLILSGKGDIRLKAQIHDSIPLQVRKELADYYRPKVLELMDNPVRIHGSEFRIPVEFKSGPNFAQLK